MHKPLFGLVLALGLNGCFGSSAEDCSRPAILRVLERLAEDKLFDSSAFKYLQPLVSRWQVHHELRDAILEKRTILKFETIRDRGARQNGRDCAAFVQIAAPKLEGVFDFSVDYFVERTGDQVVVTATFSPK